MNDVSASSRRACSRALAVFGPLTTCLILSTGVPLRALEDVPLPPVVDPPAAVGSAYPALAVEGPTTLDRRSEILLTWLTEGADGGRLAFSRFGKAGWTPVTTITTPAQAPTDGDRASLTVVETHAVRRTLIAHTGAVVARSGDGGRTWERLQSAPLSRASFAGSEEAAFAFWLEGLAGDGAQLLGTRVLAGRTVLDPRVVPNVGTAAAMTWDGPLVAYRDLADDGGTDIAIVRRENSAWSAPLTVHAEHWHPARPPRSGPQMVASERRVAVAWYTEAPRPRLLAAFSTDAGRSFGAPAVVDEQEAARSPWGPVAIALEEDGNAIVLWLAITGSSETSLELARITPDGKRSPAVTVAKGALSSARGEPQLAVADELAVVAWVEGSGAATKIRTRTFPRAAIPAALEPLRPSSAVPAAAPRPPATPKSPPADVGHGRVGDPLPALSFATLDGGKASFGGLRGRAMLVNLWATWCAPCVAELPELAAIGKRYAARGLALIGVDADGADSLERVRAFARARNVPFSVWLDPEMTLARALRVQGLPSTFVVDRAGTIVLRLDRLIDANDKDLLAAIERALGDGS